jgi:hypothetical protein
MLILTLEPVRAACVGSLPYFYFLVREKLWCSLSARGLAQRRSWPKHTAQTLCLIGLKRKKKLMLDDQWPWPMSSV